METKIYGDFLTRTKTVEDIVSIVTSCINMKESVTFSIEGEWGRGKTWVIQKVADSLNGIDLTKEQKASTKKKSDGDCLVFTYNAWEKDYYEEPLLGMLITIINQLNKELLLENLVKGELSALYEEAKSVLEECLRSISMRIIGIDVVDLGKHGIDIVKKIKSKSKINMETECAENNVEKDIQIVVKALGYLSKMTPIIFIVDELDRCLPKHAIKTLERLHHIFGKIDSSVTIIAVNEKQLRKTVEQMFGTDVPFESYLRKFVDFRIDLDGGSADIFEIYNKLKSFFEQFGKIGDEILQKELVANLCDLMTVREFEKVCANAYLCHKIVGKDTTGFPRDCAVAEILLFACKIAMEREENRANIVPLYGNNPTTGLGTFLKSHFQKHSGSVIKLHNNSYSLVYYICMMGLLTKNELERYTVDGINAQYATIIEFYEEYVRYYKMIK